MPAAAVILLDVDNTIVKKNLLVSFLSTFALVYPKTALKLGNTLAPALYALQSALAVKQEEFFYHRDFSRLDRQTISIYEDFFKYFKLCCSRVGLTDNHMAYHTENSLYQYDINQSLYPEALSFIGHHLNQPNTSIFLLSANLEELIVPFALKLAKDLNLTDEQQGRLYCAGSKVNEKTDAYDVCVGSHKVDILEKSLAEMSNPIITSAYSDNHYFTDLPMLAKAQQERVIIGERTELYEELHEIKPFNFTFSPHWKKPV